MLPTPEELQVFVQLANTIGLAVLAIWMLVFRDPKMREATADEFREIRERNQEHVSIITAKFTTAIETQAKIFRSQLLDQMKICIDENSRIAASNREDRNLQHQQILSLTQAISQLESRLSKSH